MKEDFYNCWILCIHDIHDLTWDNVFVEPMTGSYNTYRDIWAAINNQIGSEIKDLIKGDLNEK